jgi:hypothetical protein
MQRAPYIAAPGPSDCKGKAVALHEIRSVVAALVRHFGMGFEDGFALAA